MRRNKKKTIFISGARGFIGRHIKNYLNKDYKLLTPDKKTLNLKNIKFVKKYFKNCRPDIIIHLAASTKSYLKKVEEKKNQINDTYNTTKNLVKSINPECKLVIFFGSMEEYGNIKSPFKESQLVNPVTNYGIYKYKSFLYVSKYQQKKKLNYIWLRPSLVFGYGDNKDRYLDNIDQSIKLIKNNLKNRGPDSQNSIILNEELQPIKEVNKTKNLIIASRLNIIDDDRKSDLPLISDCKKYILSFNGEIYNFKELKKKYLNNIEHKTNSDTEVLLNLLKYKGEYILNELNGIFALSFYDLKKKKFLLARDRLGIKPLYYYFKNNTFSYSSDVKNILIFKDVRKKINKNLSALFLSNISSIKNNETFFDGIEKLQGGNFLIFDLKNFIIEKYKNYWFVPKNVDPKVYTGMELYNDLHLTIERQSINNRDIAITLSGGLDSSILGLLLRDIYPEKKINAYSFTFSQN